MKCIYMLLFLTGSFQSAQSQAYIYRMDSVKVTIHGTHTAMVVDSTGIRDCLYHISSDSLFYYEMNADIDPKDIYLYFTDAVSLKDISRRDLRVVKEGKDIYGRKYYCLEIYSADNSTGEFTENIFTSWRAPSEGSSERFSFTGLLFTSKKEARALKKALRKKIPKP